MGNKVIMKPKTKVHLFLVLRTKEWKKMQLTKFKLSSFLGIPSIYQYCSQDCWRGDEHAWNEIPRLVYKNFENNLSAIVLTAKIDAHIHSGWKSQKMSYSTLRAKRTLFTFSVDKSSLKKVENWWKLPKLENSNETFWVIFNQCDFY